MDRPKGRTAQPATPGIAKQTKKFLDFFLWLWLYSAMPEPPTTTPTVPPDPHEDRSGAIAAAPSRSGRLLGLVRKLIDYGFELANTLRRRAAANDVAVMVRPFGTIDLALIMARITRGLRLAGALEERLMRHPVPEEKKPASTSAPSQRQPRAARPRAARRTVWIPTRARAECPPRSKSPRTSAAARSAPSSPISAAISASCPGIGYGGNSHSPSSTTAAASPG